MAKKKKKKSSLLTKAKSLGKSKYAPILSEINSQQGNNLSLYTGASNQRVDALNREVGSIAASGSTTKRYMDELGNSTASAYQKAMAESQDTNKNLLSKIEANNNSLLSTTQQSMKENGLEGWRDLSPITKQNNTSKELAEMLGSIYKNSLTTGALNAKENNDRAKEMAEMQTVTATSGARGTAQSDLSDLYNKYLAQRMDLESQNRKTKLEQSDYTMQTYETLKDRAAQAKAQKVAAAAASAAAAGNLAYKYEALKTNTQYKYDKLASDVSQKDIENRLKKAGLRLSIRKQLAAQAAADDNFKLKLDKFDWEKNKPAATKQDLAAIMAAVNSG